MKQAIVALVLTVGITGIALACTTSTITIDGKLLTCITCGNNVNCF